MLLYHLVATQLVALTREPLGMKLPLFVVRFVSAVICAALLLESILLWLVAVPNLVVLVAAAVFPRLCWLCPNDVWVDQTFCYTSTLRRIIDASLKSLLDCLHHSGARRYPRSYVGVAFPYARTVRFVLALFFIPPLVPYCILLHLLSLWPKAAKLLHHKLCPPIRPLSSRSVRPSIIEVVELWIQDVVLETNRRLGFL